MIGTLALVPQIVDEVTVPVIAAGGIMDARGLVARSGARRSRCADGYRFSRLLGSASAQARRDALLQADGSATVVTETPSGKPARGLNNNRALKRD
ncbi:MAG: nitronate monooxygenase [Gammaproteobacteria bacterium]